MTQPVKGVGIFAPNSSFVHHLPHIVHHGTLTQVLPLRHFMVLFSYVLIIKTILRPEKKIFLPLPPPSPALSSPIVNYLLQNQGCWGCCLSLSHIVYTCV